MLQITSNPVNNAVTRFAPSPTGYLHLGHVASAIFVWGIGRKISAKVLLRSENHDLSRYRKPFEAAMFTDLTWLGLKADNGDFVADTPSSYRQSDSLNAYAEAVAQLNKSHKVYACDCSRRLSASNMVASSEPAELCYDGRCRNRRLPLDSPGVGWRVEIPPGTQVFNDLLLGPCQQESARQCGDLLLRDRHGHYTYNFCVVVDDLRHGVNLVIRGQDLTHATGRQLWLGAALGRPDYAQFLHHPLIYDSAGKKLSKRTLAEGIAQRRARGEQPAQVLGLAAHLAGLQDQPEPLSAAELTTLFVWEATPCQSSP